MKRKRMVESAVLGTRPDEETKSSEGLTAALRPFADMAIPGDEKYSETVICTRGEFNITYGDLHRAKVALEAHRG